jgi:hypothetical protein
MTWESAAQSILGGGKGILPCRSGKATGAKNALYQMGLRHF